MFRLNRIVKICVLCVLLCQPVLCNAQSADGESPPICEADEYILLAKGSNYAEIYDSQGTCVGGCRAYLDGSGGAVTVKRDSLLEYTSGEVSRIFSMAELDNILEFPVEEYYPEIYGSVCLATNRSTGQYSLYDCHGKAMYSSPEKPWTDGSYQTRILDVENGYLIGLIRYGEDGAVCAGTPVWIRRDGQEIREITDFGLGEAFAAWSVYKFGEHILIYESATETGAVYDLDGNILLDGVSAYTSTYMEDNCQYSYHYQMWPALVFRFADGMYTAYNAELEETAMFPAPEDGSIPRYGGGFLESVPYRQLDGNRCAGFVRYKGRSWVPYAKTEEGFLVYADGKQTVVPLEWGEELSSLSDAYVMTEYYDDEIYREKAIFRKTGEVLAESHWEMSWGMWSELGGDSCIITETRVEDEGSRNLFTILDENGQVCCSCENGLASPWKNGYIVLNRGIYNGIADRNGNWIVKTVYEAEE